MKKIVSVVFVSAALTLLVFSCKKDSSSKLTTVDQLPAPVAALAKSGAISRNSEIFSSYGTLDYEKAIIKDLALASTAEPAYLILVPITFQGRVVAQLEAVKTARGKLPHDDEYALNLLDIKQYDTKTMSGQISMLDVNYNFYNHSQVSVRNNKIMSWKAKGLSKELMLKYNNPAFKQTSKAVTGHSNVQQREAGGIYGLCDSNGNHNISFSECYKCATDAISADGFSSFVCEFPVAGWLSCWGTKSASCVVVSSMY